MEHWRQVDPNGRTLVIEVDVYNDPAGSILMAVALDAAARYKWVPFDDLHQEAWVWRLRHPQYVAELLEKGSSQLQRAVADYLRLVAQRERAAQTGYHPDDVVYYTPAMIAGLLPQAVDILEATAPKGGDQEDTKGPSDPHGQSGFVTSLIDVANAWLITPYRDDEKQILRLRYIDDLNWGEIALSLGHDMEEVKRRAAIGLRRTVDILGGWRGKECPTDCPDCTERRIEEDA